MLDKYSLRWYNKNEVIDMGQYYKTINLDTKQHLNAHSYDNGVKLMEHSWVGNNFVGAVEVLLQPGNPWYKTRIVWAGDYGDDGLFLDDPKFKEMVRNEKDKVDYIDLVTDEDIEKKFAEMSLYSFADDFFNLVKKETIKELSKTNCNYIVNYTKKEFVRKKDGPVASISRGFKWVIHPLPLLTSNGNNRGGGDFRAENDYVGTWAGDIIGMERLKPSKEFKEIVPDFIEG